MLPTAQGTALLPALLLSLATTSVKRGSWSKCWLTWRFLGTTLKFEFWVKKEGCLALRAHKVLEIRTLLD